ncbi:hypothetical protein Celaphus_00010597 [Cervus elaphus hippelaphus]|uniref:Uncharacterized protein n=1 Tax=Cervus elaphus hippelaphus TaxID=46360 RepID=A0A212CA82_CEREH|nr:hypothetical protein Celaphus_00010597 [Cervus elaphus hippelaphus]
MPGEVKPPSLPNRGQQQVASTCSMLTLHGLDEVPDGVGTDAESRALLHELGWDVVVAQRRQEAERPPHSSQPTAKG